MAELQRVSFRKSRASLPRLSPRYVPGRRHPRFWHEDELQVLRDHYEVEGPRYCRSKLPKKRLSAIYVRARQLGLKAPHSPHVRRRHPTDGSLDPQIRTAWPGLSGKGAVKHLAEDLGVPRWWLSHRAKALGLAIPRMTKEPPWTAAEDALMKRVPLHDPDRCHEIFREHGFQRTATAIVVRAKRLNISRRYRDTFSATAIARVFGVDSKTTTGWILKGLLKAAKRATRRLPQQGGDPWSVTRDELRRFLIEQLDMIDFRKVDKFAIVDLLAAAPAQPSAEVIELHVRRRKNVKPSVKPERGRVMG